MSKQTYGDVFYKRQRDGSFASAMAVLPLVQAICAPRSIVDFGCGVGTWLAAARALGVQEVAGLEGSWVRSQQPMIDGDSIQDADLEQPVKLAKRYDMAVSLEVAEHLSRSRAAGFVDDLCAASDIVLFSAACPGQDGDGHLNEQWPSFWASLFLQRGYLPLDLIRPQIASDERVEPWYRTNVLLFAEHETGLRLFKNASQHQLSGLDLPYKVEAAGVKRSFESFLHYARRVAFFGSVRVGERLRLRASFRHLVGAN